MRTFILVVALFGLTLANLIPAEVKERLADEPSVAAFMECVKKALDGGLEEAQIPDHNPFVFTRNLTFPIDVTGISGWIKIEPATIGGIVDFETQSEVSVVQATATNIVYNYKFYWPQLAIHGDYVSELKVLLINHDYEGTIDLDLNHAIFEGVWDLDLETMQLNNFTIAITTKEVVADIKGFGLLIDPILSAGAASGLQGWLDSDPDAMRDLVGPGLQKKINEAWLAPDKFYRVEAIVANCHANSTEH